MARTGDSNNGNDSATVERLLGVIRALTSELRPGRSNAQSDLDIDLDRDLGYDSLSRAELLLRVEREFNVRLPEQLLGLAETPRDLLDAVRTAQPPRAEPAIHRTMQAPAPSTRESRLPADVATLNEMLAWWARQHPDRIHVQLYETGSETPVGISYLELHLGAKKLAAGLAQRGLEPGQSVAIMLPTGREYLESFFGVLLAGGVPVPIYPPVRPSQLEDHLHRHARILANAGMHVLITVPEAVRVGKLLRAHVETLREVVTPGSLNASGGAFNPLPIDPDDMALLQYTSGSTGQPKGVILTHRQLLTNIRVAGDWIGAGPEDVFVSWLPMYHDMGLIGAWLGSLLFGMRCILMSPMAFLARPWRWLWAVHDHQGTITAGPNFAYELCLSKIPDDRLEGLDLGSLRVAFNGAEPVSPQTVRRFRERYLPHGLAPDALTPVYGLAECAVALAFPPMHRGPLIDRVRRAEFERAGRAVPATSDEPAALEFVACGQPLPGYQIRIVDHASRELADREEGRLQFKGPSATLGYMANPGATRELFDGDWLNSGDLAYIAGGDVYLTGRAKDIVIRAGRNIYPHELEEAVGDLADIRKGCVAVFGSPDPHTGTEQLIVVAESRQTDPGVLEGLQRRIQALTIDLLGVAPDEILVAPPHTVLKTSSGKIRRAACRELYLAGKLNRGARAPWRQLVRLWLGGLGLRWQRLRRSAADLGYAVYAYLLFGLFAPIAVIGMVILPRLESRWALVGWCARQLLRLAGVPVLLHGNENLPACGAGVIVANHGSYIDGLVLLAVLPRPVSFVAKAELRARPFARWFLGRLRARFVERFDIHQGTEDAKSLSSIAREDQTLMFFPEGTFTRYPGLLSFYMGAFLVAADNGLPVVPVTIRGSRSVLRGDDWFPRRQPIAVIVGEPIRCRGNDWDAAVELRNRSRAQILRHLGEPDRAFERVVP